MTDTAPDPCNRRLRAVGSSGVLIEVDGGAAAQRLATWVDAHEDRAALAEVIPGARTVYLAGPLDVATRIAQQALVAPFPDAVDASRLARTVVVDVRYDGPDLDETALHLGLTREDVVRRHTDRDFSVQFFGFSPGQAFLAGLPESLQLPRRPTPRTIVPSGAVAIANEFTVIYPRSSPGGWNLIGTRVSEPLWDAAAEPPNRVEIGDTVRFRAVT